MKNVMIAVLLLTACAAGVSFAGVNDNGNPPNQTITGEQGGPNANTADNNMDNNMDNGMNNAYTNNATP